MASAAEPFSSPVLVYDRIDQNVRDTRLLLGFFIVLVLPALAFLVEYGAVWLLMLSPAVMANLQSQQQMISMWFLMGGFILLGLLVFAAFRYFAAVESTLHTLGARPPLPEESEYVRTVENLCIGAGLPQPQLYVVDTWLPNAFSVGFRPESASLVVTRGLLDLLDRLELEGVIAHELSHIGNRDSRLNTVLSVMLRTMIIPLPIRIVLWLGIVLSVPLYFVDAEMFSDFPPQARILIAVQSVLVIWALLWPWVGRLIQHAVSRRRELLADADAALLTRYPAGLARALSKAGSAIAVGGATAVRQSAGFAHPAFSHLFLLTPITTWELFDPHPPVGERVAALAGMDTTITPAELEQATAAGKTFTETRDFKPGSKDVGQDQTDWLDSLPGMLHAALRGIRYGMLAMVVFFVISGILPILMGARLSVDDIRNTLPIAASIGYAVAGYASARQFAPQRRLALLGCCFILYFVWMFAGASIAMMLERAAAGAQVPLLQWLLGSVALVVIGGLAGAAIQAAIVTGAIWSLLRRRPARRPGLQYLMETEDELAARRITRPAPATHSPEVARTDINDKSEAVSTSNMQQPVSAQDEPHSPTVPTPEHRAPCPHCGAMMADTDTICVWCGQRRTS